MSVAIEDGDTDQSQPDSYFGAEEVDNQTPFIEPLRFPHYYQYATDDDDTQGEWVLSDATSCKVTWNRNQIPTLQMNYPRDGSAAKMLQTDGIIMSDVNSILVHQKFRIKEIQKDQNQLVINATHIIGDISGITLAKSLQLPNATATDFFNALMNNCTAWIPDIRFDSSVGKISNVNIDMTSGNLSNYIFDTDAEGDTPTQSLLGLFGGELTPDNYHLIHNEQAGKDTGVVVRYGRNIQSIQQDKNIDSTYNGIYPYATYNASRPEATATNVQWEDWQTDWDGIATVTYSAGGKIDIYDTPLAGHNVIAQMKTGTRLKVGTAVEDGSTTPDKKYTIHTANSTTYYPVKISSNGHSVIGWVSANWINFSKAGDYLINNADGYVHTAIKDSETKTTVLPIRGTGTCNWTEGSRSIRYFSRPNGNSARTKYHGKRYMKYGTRFNYIAKAYDYKGNAWYELARSVWVFGPHVKVNSEQDITRYPSTGGRGYIKKNAPAYRRNKQGMFVPKTHRGKLMSTRHHKKPKIIYVHHGRGKKRHLVPKKTYTYGKPRYWHKKARTHIKRGYAWLNKGQYSVGGTIYYKVSNNTYVKSSSVDWKASRSHKPKTPAEYDKNKLSRSGTIQMFSGVGTGKIIAYVPVKKGFRVVHTGTDAAGNTWYEITYNKQTGWIKSDLTDFSAVGDKEPSAPEDGDEDDDATVDSDTSTNVDKTQVLVTLGDGEDGVMYADNYIDSAPPRILNVDLSEYFTHDNTNNNVADDGTYQETEDDIEELRGLAQGYIAEHQIGVIPVSTSVNYPQFTDIDGDVSELNMYDRVTVDFEKLGIQETAEVSSTVWDAMAQHYESVTIGDLPRTWQHELLSEAKKNTDDLAKSTRNSLKHDHHLFQEMRVALKQEGTDRKDAEYQIAKQVDLVNQKTNQLDISWKQLDQQIQNISADVTQISNEILSGGTQELQFYPNILHPTEIRAKADDDDHGYLVFNSSGLGYFDTGTNTVRSAITSDGKIAAEYIDSGEIQSLHVNSGEFTGALNVGRGTGIEISIGTHIPSQSHLAPSYGGNAIWLDTPSSDSYHALLSTGMLRVRDGSNEWEYGTNGVRYSTNRGSTWHTLHRTLTIRGKKYNLFD